MASVNQHVQDPLSTPGNVAAPSAMQSQTDYLTTIGLEVHAQLLTRSKMFCGCAADIAYAPPNTHVCPICLGMPGTLPAINTEAVRKLLLTGLALNCTIPDFSKFDRKNYPYPDLMKGYQISQYDLPLCVNGYLEIEDTDAQSKIQNPKPKIGINRVHLEEDTARLLHRTGSDGIPYSLMDVNRSGVPLMEIVSAPDIASPEEAQLYLIQLRHLLRWIGVSTGNMEEGAFRVDANVSVRPAGQAEFGTKVEIKNMNSFKAVRAALEYEVVRQAEVLRSGGRIVQETRGWVEDRGITVSQRTKEQAHDYRYFPEPDLPPLTFTDEDRANLSVQLPELPYARRNRLVEQYGISRHSAAQLINSAAQLMNWQRAVGYFEEAAKGTTSKNAQTIASYIINNLGGLPPDEFSLPVLKLRELGQALLEVCKADSDTQMANLNEPISKFCEDWYDEQKKELGKALLEFSSQTNAQQLNELGQFLLEFGSGPKNRFRDAYIRDIKNFISNRTGEDQLQLARQILEFTKDRSAQQLRELVELIDQGIINLNIARGLATDMFESGRSPNNMVKERGLAIVKDESALEKAVDEAIAANPKAVTDYLGGKESALAAFLGPIMKATRGQADPNATRELLKRKLEEKRKT